MMLAFIPGGGLGPIVLARAHDLLGSYRPGFAGAVEAVASTGGQIMPPIMGAAAFVMAEFLGVSYLHVAAAALIPAVLYFLAVFTSVHFEARRTGMKGLPRADLPRLGQVTGEIGNRDVVAMPALQGFGLLTEIGSDAVITGISEDGLDLL